MSNVTNIPNGEKSVRQLAEEAIRKEMSDKALSQMKAVLRERYLAQQVLVSIDIKIADLERQIADGTL